MATRLLGQTTPSSKPVTPTEWDRLMQKALARAKLSNDPRLSSLQTAMQKGKAATALKRLGIIGENDLLREFPIRDK